MSVITHPAVVRGGEIQLRDDFDSKAVEPVYFRTHLLYAPRPFDSQFGMGRVEQAFSEVYYDHVDAALGSPVGCPAPKFIRTDQMKVRLLLQALYGLLHVLSHLGRRVITPHIVSQVEEHGTDVSDSGLCGLGMGFGDAGFSRARCAADSHACGNKSGRGGADEIPSVQNIDV